MEDPTNPKEEKSSRGSSNNNNSGWTTSDAGDGSLAPAPQPKGGAAVVPAVGGGPSPEEHSKVEDQPTLRERLETLVSHKLRTLGDLDHAGLAALEALNKLPAAPREQQQPPASNGVKKNFRPPFGKIKKFSGKDPQYLTDCLNQFYNLVVTTLHPGTSPAGRNKALTRDVVSVLEGSALTFFTALKAGEVQWEATPPVLEEGAQGGGSSSQQQQQQEDGRGGKRFRPPSTWREVHEALHDHYLPVKGIARTSEKLFSSTQAPDESVLSLAQRQLGLGSHLKHLIEANGEQISYMEAISIRLFERALRADLRRIQEAEPPCSSFQESVDRAERNAVKLAKKTGSTDVAQDNNGGSGASSGLVVPIARSAVASSEGGDGGGGGGVSPGAIQTHDHKSDHDGSETDGREERSSHTAPQGRNAVGSGHDAGHEAGEALPTTGPEPGGGEGEGGPGFEKHHKQVRRVKRTRNWPEMHHDGGGADQPFPPPQGKRTRDWPEMHHGGGGADRPFPPPQGKRMRDWPEMPRGGGGAGQPFPPHQGNRTRDWPEMPHGGGGPDQAFPPPQRARVDPGSIPPCRVSVCKAINRNFHCSNECYYHPTFGARNKARGNFGRKKSFRRSQPEHWGPQQHHNDGSGGQ